MNRKRRRFRISCCVVWLLACQPLGCSQKSSTEAELSVEVPQIVVLYVPCSVGKRFLSPYNEEITYTPQIDSFAKSATVFMNHRTEAGQCGIAFASLLTGNQAPDHGVFADPTRLADSVYDITEAFADNGYDVYVWNDHTLGSAALNFGQGVSSDRVFNRALEQDDADFNALLKRLAFHKSDRAFVLVNYRAVQQPYQSDKFLQFRRDYAEVHPDLAALSIDQLRRIVMQYYQHRHVIRYDFERFRQEQNLTDAEVQQLTDVMNVLYKSKIHAVDDLFGGVVTRIDNAGLGDNSLIAFTADHGESLDRPHAPFKWSHEYTVQADVLDVPLIIRPPNRLRRPGQTSLVTRSVDVFPTLASLAQLELPAGAAMEGQDLSKFMQPEHEVPDLEAYSHSGMVFPGAKEPSEIEKLMDPRMAKYYPAADMAYTWVAVRRGDTVWKYRPLEGQDFVFQAFDVATDPAESTDILDQSKVLHQEMSEKLVAYKKRLVSSYREWASADAQGLLDDSKQLELLRKMGSIK